MAEPSIMSLAADVSALPAGQAPARLAKRAADERPYLIDLAPLLGWHELALGVEHIEAPGLGVGPARTRLGRYLEVRLAGGEVDHPRPHQDHGLSATVRTTRGAVAVAVDVRVHAR
ncbi:hypothetical protein [Aquariibacter albus]|uniref:Uncharacterized protein n=1 Tax=Aquariibacter albus TaxID=2759899 RepID=A0A839HQ89_9BURK|nr:hypothetical protein [Aquariibacter albus]MBB1161469.1 hypothetical protein [Aquariibacter albus]